MTARPLSARENLDVAQLELQRCTSERSARRVLARVAKATAHIELARMRMVVGDKKDPEERILGFLRRLAHPVSGTAPSGFAAGRDAGYQQALADVRSYVENRTWERETVDQDDNRQA